MRTSAFAFALASCFVAATASGCGSSAPAPSVVHIRVIDEAKAPVPGAQIAASGTVVATTDAEGRASVEVAGREGETFGVDVRCPVLYRSPPAPLAIRRLPTMAADAPEYVARCSRTRHTLVVAVRAEGGGNLPVLHLGKEVARTDESGSAHVLVEGDVHERVELLLSTSGAPAHAKLHPQNPVVAFEVGERDEIVVFDVKFTREAKPVRRAAPRVGPRAF